MNKFCISVLLSFLFVYGLQAEGLKGSGDTTFAVKATAHTVHGKAELKPFEVMVKTVDEDKFLSFKVEVDVLTLNTDNEKRDQELYHFLHAEAHPLIQGEAKNISLDTLKAESEEPILIPFTFTMIGKTVEREAELVSIAASEKGIELAVKFDLLQTEHGLKPIRKLGLLKVKDQVRVEVNFSLAP